MKFSFVLCCLLLGVVDLIALTREQVAAEGILMYRLSTSKGIWTGKMEVMRSSVH